MDLVACLSTGKGTWIHVNQMINQGNWNKVFLITNEFGKENFRKADKVELIVIDDRKEIEEMRDEIQEKLKPLLREMEVCVNLVSGSGKEHMALISALLKLGLCIKFYASTPKGIEEV